MRHIFSLAFPFILIFGLIAQPLPVETVRVDNLEIHTFKGKTGKWVLFHTYRESVSRVIEQFGSTAEEFMQINSLTDMKRISQREPYFIPYGEGQIRNLIANGNARKYLKSDPRDFVLPVSAKFYRITSRMGKRWNVMHNGLDIACPRGSAVIAAADGVVSLSSFHGNYGKTIIIHHEQLNNVDTIYAHNSQLLVREGEIVKKGQIIALSGNTGHSTGPHVHFEVRYDTVALNPEHYLSGMINDQKVVALENLQDFGIQ